MPGLALRWGDRGCGVPVNHPALADAEIATATFSEHLAKYWAGGRPAQLGWERIDLLPLHTVIRMPARRTSAPTTVDHYYIKLGAEYYDAAPPTVGFVVPELWTPAPSSSRWFPKIQTPPWFGLHDKYPYPDGQQRQLVCFTFSAEYYMTEHSPKETERWTQGRHTVAATLNRLAEILSPPYYQEPSA